MTGLSPAMRRLGRRALARPEAATILVLAAALALGGAFVVEHVMGIAPCELCLVERWPWRVVLVLGILGVTGGRRLGWFAIGASFAVLLLSTGLGVLHVGVEAGAWPSPFPACHTPPLPAGETIGDQLLAMPMRANKPCDDATYLIPGVPVSMAAMNLILSAVVALVVGAALLSRGRGTDARGAARA